MSSRTLSVFAGFLILAGSLVAIVVVIYGTESSRGSQSYSSSRNKGNVYHQISYPKASISDDKGSGKNSMGTQNNVLDKLSNGERLEKVNRNKVVEERGEGALKENEKNVEHEDNNGKEQEYIEFDEKVSLSPMLRDNGSDEKDTKSRMKADFPLLSDPVGVNLSLKQLNRDPRLKFPSDFVPNVLNLNKLVEPSQPRIEGPLGSIIRKIRPSPLPAMKDRNESDKENVDENSAKEENDYFGLGRILDLLKDLSSPPIKFQREYLKGEPNEEFFHLSSDRFGFDDVISAATSLYQNGLSLQNVHTFVKMMNESLNEGKGRGLLEKLNELYGESAEGKHGEEKVIGRNTHETSFTAFAFLSFGIFLLNQIHGLIEENKIGKLGARSLFHGERINDIETSELNLLFLPPKESFMGSKSNVGRRYYNESIEEVLKRVENNNTGQNGQMEDQSFQQSRIGSMDRGMNTGEWNSGNVNNMFRALLNLVNAYTAKNSTALECIWSMYCMDLDATAAHSDLYGIAARINSIGLRLIMEQIEPEMTFDVLLRSLMKWSGLPCERMFNRGTMYSVVSHLYSRPQKQKRSNRGRRQDLSCPARVIDYIRTRFYQDKGSGGEDEADELTAHVTRYRPEELDKLTKTTKFTKKEIQLIYRGFKQECPTGLVDEDAFKDIFAQFFPQGDASQYAHYVFNTIKQNASGQISFEQFLGILSKVSRGTIQEKLQWIFGLYDLNGDGLITKNEMLDVVTSIYEMLGRSTEPQVEDNSAKEHVERIFHQIDLNHDGVVTIDELVEWCSRDERVLQSLEMLDTVL